MTFGGIVAPENTTHRLLRDFSGVSGAVAVYQ